MSVLLFGFEPFLEFDENPTELVAKSIDGAMIGGHRVTGVTLPVDYSTIERRILASIKSVKPSLVLGFGLAAGRKAVTPEKVAVNYINSKMKDNSGRRLDGVPIDTSQPDGLFTNLPVEGLVDALNKAGMPASLSLSAGSYLCNNSMFLTLREARRLGFAGGFIHVPTHAEWVARSGKHYPSLPIATIKKAARFSVGYYLRHFMARPKSAAGALRSRRRGAP